MKTKNKNSQKHTKLVVLFAAGLMVIILLIVLAGFDEKYLRTNLSGSVAQTKGYGISGNVFLKKGASSFDPELARVRCMHNPELEGFYSVLYNEKAPASSGSEYSKSWKFHISGIPAGEDCFLGIDYPDGQITKIDPKTKLFRLSNDEVFNFTIE